MAAQAGVQVVRGFVDIVKILPHLNAIKDAMKLGASLPQALALSNTVFQGGRLSVMAGAEGAAMAGTTLAVTAFTKALGGLGAVIGIADAIISWSSTNPNRKSAEDLLPKLEENLKSLEETKVKFEKNEDDGDLNNQMLCFNQTISNSHDKFKLLISCVTALFLFLSFLCDDQTASTLRLARSFIISERNVEYLRQTPYLYVMRVCIDFHYENVRVGEFSLIPFYRCTQLQQRLLLK